MVMLIIVYVALQLKQQVYGKPYINCSLLPLYWVLKAVSNKQKRTTLNPRRIPYAGNEADGVTVNYKDKYNQQLQSIKDNYKTFDLPYNGQDNNDFVNGQGFCCNDGSLEAAQALFINHDLK